MVYFECSQCGARRVVVARRFLAAVLGRHRDEHPDHDQAIVGWAEAVRG